MRNKSNSFRGSLFGQPLLNVVQNHLISYPTPSNLTGNWNWGVLAGLCLVLQIVTGIFLAMHYTAHVDYAFHSVQHLMRDVPNGWLLRYLHQNGQSLFFIVVYMHLFRGLYYTSYAQPREAVWLIGVIILLLMILTRFIGYVLPWGFYLAQNNTSFLTQEFIEYSNQLLFVFEKRLKHTNTEKYIDCFFSARLQSQKRVGPHRFEVFSLIFGLLIGDQHRQYRNGSTRICIHYSSKNVQYLYWIHGQLSKFGYCNQNKPSITKQCCKKKVKPILV